MDECKSENKYCCQDMHPCIEEDPQENCGDECCQEAPAAKMYNKKVMRKQLFTKMYNKKVMRKQSLPGYGLFGGIELGTKKSYIHSLDDKYCSPEDDMIDDGMDESICYAARELANQGKWRLAFVALQREMANMMVRCSDQIKAMDRAYQEEIDSIQDEYEESILEDYIKRP